MSDKVKKGQAVMAYPSPSDSTTVEVVCFSDNAKTIIKNMFSSLPVSESGDVVSVTVHPSLQETAAEEINIRLNSGDQQ